MLPLLLAVSGLVACADPAPSSVDEPAIASTSPTFVNRVWRVAASPTVAVGQLYVFLSDGTLVVTSRDSTPALGRWHIEDGTLTMVEEGIPYRVEVITLTADTFEIRLHDPGDGVEMRLVPAHAGDGGS